MDAPSWDISLSLASPGSTTSIDAASSMDYINSQLMAHGFVSAPGIVLGDISNADSERLVKCLLGMLSQRVEDMSRTEELTTKLRTLTYDHERLRSMNREAVERAANAEREMNVHKSRLNAATRTLQTSEAANKQITAELQRTRALLQGVRATHQTELKKKEKDIERMSEKWSKIADAQAKLMAVPSGLQCANAAVMSGSVKMGNRSSFLEVALEDAEKARSQLYEENSILRNLLMTAVNEVRSALHHVRPLASESVEEPTLFTLSTLFPLHPVGTADDKVATVLNELKDTLTTMAHKPSIAVTTPPAKHSQPTGEIERLQGIIASLQAELELALKQSTTQVAETRAMFDKFTKDHRMVTGDIGEMSIELMSAPLCDLEKERLDAIKKELDNERQKFTEAAIELGKERAEIQAERIRLMDEKRCWHVQMMLADLPPTPPTSSSHPEVVAAKLVKKSPRKSPAKVRVGKAGTSAGRKTTRVLRRSSLVSPSKVLPPYETEFLQPLPALALNPLPNATPLLPTSFVLPPPSPRTSLPMQDAILAPSHIPEPLEASPPQSTTPLSPTPSPEASASGVPSTPPAAQRLFPMAKPFAQRMIHAYSPAKPSPLSRILMLGKSPTSPGETSGSGDTYNLLKPVVEEDEYVSKFEALSSVVPPQLSLAAELGILESSTESENPLQDKKVEPNANERPAAAKGRTVKPDSKRFPSQEKGKAKAMSGSQVTVGRNIKTSAGFAKENSLGKTDGKVFRAPPKISPPGATAEKKIAKPPSKTSGVSASRSRPTAKLHASATGGPRRVLVDSDEAPAVGKGRKG